MGKESGLDTSPLSSLAPRELTDVKRTVFEKIAERVDKETVKGMKYPVPDLEER